jgi:tetratricopeptide (TPR) repeat protein
VAIWFALANYIWLALAGYYILASLSSALQESTRMARTLATVKGLLGIEASRALAPELPLIPLLLTGGAAFLLSLVVAWGVYRRSPLFYWLTVGAILLFPLVTVYQASIAEKASLWVLAIKGLVFLAAVGLAFMAHDEFAFVERRLAAVVDRDGDNPSTLYLRGREYARQGMWARAQVHWAKAVALRPGKIDYRLALATAYVNLGQAERAEAHLSVAQQIEPENPQLQALLTHARATC